MKSRYGYEGIVSADLVVIVCFNVVIIIIIDMVVAGRGGWSTKTFVVVIVSGEFNIDIEIVIDIEREIDNESEIDIESDIVIVRDIDIIRVYISISSKRPILRTLSNPDKYHCSHK